VVEEAAEDEEGSADEEEGLEEAGGKDEEVRAEEEDREDEEAAKDDPRDDEERVVGCDAPVAEDDAADVPWDTADEEEAGAPLLPDDEDEVDVVELRHAPVGTTANVNKRRVSVVRNNGLATCQKRVMVLLGPWARLNGLGSGWRRGDEPPVRRCVLVRKRTVGP
jgi:hypothetical protein